MVCVFTDISIRMCIACVQIRYFFFFCYFVISLFRLTKLRSRVSFMRFYCRCCWFVHTNTGISGTHLHEFIHNVLMVFGSNEQKSQKIVFFSFVSSFFDLVTYLIGNTNFLLGFYSIFILFCNCGRNQRNCLLAKRRQRNGDDDKTQESVTMTRTNETKQNGTIRLKCIF